MSQQNDILHQFFLFQNYYFFFCKGVIICIVPRRRFPRYTADNINLYLLMCLTVVGGVF